MARKTTSPTFNATALHLRSLDLRSDALERSAGFPYQLEIFQGFEKIEFNAPVTFFVGENGSGKSTLMEALACAAGSITVGSESVKTDPTLEAVRRFSQLLQLSWSKRTHRGFFLRAEDFFGYARKMSQVRAELEEDLHTVDREYQGRSAMAVSLAKLPMAHELYDMKQKYDGDLEAHSHGESFLSLFQSRFVPNGFYLLDEPEAPLSPFRQLAFLSLLKSMIQEESQFIIATHSPILMAFPGAAIYSFDDGHIHPVAYEELEHVRLTRDFLNDPQAFLNHL
jgi:predicted ATPase